MASGLLRPELLLSRVSGAPLEPLRPFDPLSGVNPLTALRAPQIGCYGSDETSSREQDEKARRVPISRPATPAASPRTPAISPAPRRRLTRTEHLWTVRGRSAATGQH